MSTSLIPADSPLLDVAAAWRPLLAEGLANDLPGFAKEAWHVLHPSRQLTCNVPRNPSSCVV